MQLPASDVSDVFSWRKETQKNKVLNPGIGNEKKPQLILHSKYIPLQLIGQIHQDNSSCFALLQWCKAAMRIPLTLVF